MLVYLTHVYSRLVHTPPIYVTTSAKSEQTVDEKEKNAANKSFILHRRHLPLSKNIEVSKLYPHFSSIIIGKPSVEASLIKINSPIASLASFLKEHRSNKAPPVTC